MSRLRPLALTGAVHGVARPRVPVLRGKLVHSCMSSAGHASTTNDVAHSQRLGRQPM